MSRLLVLLPVVPAPLDTGAKIRNHGLLKLLAANHEVDAIAFGPPGWPASPGAASSPGAPGAPGALGSPGSLDVVGELARLVRRAAIVAEPRARPAVRRALDLARSTLPDLALRRWSPEFDATVRRFLADGAYDAVQAEGIEMARYLCAVPRDRRIYDAHNAEFLLQQRFSTTASSGFLRLYSRLQWRRLERFERRLVQGCRLTLAVSQHDANQLYALAGERANVHVVPNGIDTAAYPLRAHLAEQAPGLLFLGKLDFRPNADSVAWFVRKVLRPLLASVPDARLFAVGAAPPRWLVEAGQHDNRIAVTGYVADERPYLARCAAMVLPLQAGGGTRLKALIAMASGLPIVSTRLGMEGLDAEPDEDFLQADTPAEWLSALQRLLTDPALQARLARAGRAFVEQRYDWSVLRTDVDAAYAKLGA